MDFYYLQNKTSLVKTVSLKRKFLFMKKVKLKWDVLFFCNSIPTRLPTLNFFLDFSIMWNYWQRYQCYSIDIFLLYIYFILCYYWVILVINRIRRISYVIYITFFNTLILHKLRSTIIYMRLGFEMKSYRLWLNKQVSKSILKCGRKIWASEMCKIVLFACVVCL